MACPKKLSLREAQNLTLWSVLYNRMIEQQEKLCEIRESFLWRRTPGLSLLRVLFVTNGAVTKTLPSPKIHSNCFREQEIPQLAILMSIGIALEWRTSLPWPCNLYIGSTPVFLLNWLPLSPPMTRKNAILLLLLLLHSRTSSHGKICGVMTEKLSGGWSCDTCLALSSWPQW